MKSTFPGLVAAPYTPFHADGSLNLSVIPAYAAFLKSRGVKSAFVCGTTGEGASLTTGERLQVASAWREVADDQLSLIVHVGHTSLGDAKTLAAHASETGTSAIAALAPYFFKPQDVETLTTWCAAIADAAPHTPFYYYHIPSMTGTTLRGADFLAYAASRIPSLAGVKYTHEDLADFAACQQVDGGRFDLLFGRDEMLLEGWQLGARGAVGSTYNYASPHYLRLIAAAEAGDKDLARKLQDQAITMVNVCNSVGVSHLAASKVVMRWLGVDCGPARLPLTNPTAAQQDDLRRKLDQIGFFEFVA